MIKLKNEELEAYRRYKVEHSILLNNLRDNIQVINFVHPNLEQFVSEPDTEDIFEVDKTYIVKHDNHSIGMIGTKNTNIEGIIEVWQVLNERYRGKGYGTKILGLLTQYIIENTQYVDDIQLSICKSNVASQISALKNGYEITGETEEKYIYRYFN